MNKQPMIHGYLIKATERQVYTVAFPDDANKLRHLYALIDCRMVDRIAIDPMHDCWVDDEGAMLDEAQAFAIYSDDDQGWRVLHGNGVVLAQHRGRSFSVVMSAPEVLGRVLFLDGGPATQVSILASVTRPYRMAGHITLGSIVAAPS